MTAAGNVVRMETPDLFAPELRRQRVVEWQAPGPVARAAIGMSGLEAMQAIRDGVLPPPLAKLIGFRMAAAEPGRYVPETGSSRLDQSRTSNWAVKRSPQTANARMNHIGLTRLRKKASKVPR